MYSENNLVKTTKFLLVQLQNLLIMKTAKCLVDPTKYFVDSIKLFIALTKLEYLVDLTKKFILINQNLFDLSKCS